MLTIYLLVLSLAQAPCESARICPADKPVVAFYFDSKQAISERDAMTQKYNKARLYRLDFNIGKFWGLHMDQIRAQARSAFSVKEIATVPVQTYETTETPVAITGGYSMEELSDKAACETSLSLSMTESAPDDVKAMLRNDVEACVQKGRLTRTQVQEAAFKRMQERLPGAKP